MHLVIFNHKSLQVFYQLTNIITCDNKHSNVFGPIIVVKEQQQSNYHVCVKIVPNKRGKKRVDMLIGF